MSMIATQTTLDKMSTDSAAYDEEVEEDLAPHGERRQDQWKEFGLQLDGIPEEISSYADPTGALPMFELSPRRLPQSCPRQSSSYSLRYSDSDFLRDSIDEIIETEEWRVSKPAHLCSLLDSRDSQHSLAELHSLLRRSSAAEPPADAYAQACATSLLAPLQSVQAILRRQAGTGKLRVPENLLTPGHGAALAGAVAGMSSLVVVDVAGNLLGDAAVSALCAALGGGGAAGAGLSSPLQTLKLDHNHLLGSCVPAVCALVKASGLLYLSLGSNPRLGNSVRALAEALADTPLLTTLDLTRVGMEDLAGHAFGEAICRNTKLLHLYLSGNKLIKSWPSIAKALCVNVTLQVLDVAHNGAAGTVGMAGMLLRNDALHTVDFTGCRFEDPALKKLASVLPATDSLKMIVVDPGVGAALVRALAATGDCKVSVKETGLHTTDEALFELTFLCNAQQAKQAATSKIRRPIQTRSRTRRCSASSTSSGESVAASWAVTSMDVLAPEQGACARVGRVAKPQEAEEWEVSCVQQLTALAEGLAGKDPDSLYVQRRVQSALDAALFRRRAHLEATLRRAEAAHAKHPNIRELKWRKETWRMNLAEFASSSTRIMACLGMVGGVDNSLETGMPEGVKPFHNKDMAMVIDLGTEAPCENTHTISLRLVGQDASLIDLPPQYELLAPKLERVLRRVYDILPECGVTMEELRSMLRNHHELLAKVHLQYSSRRGIGEELDHLCAANESSPNRHRDDSIASDADSISMRQVWHFVRNCNIVRPDLSLAHINQVAVICRRSNDDESESLDMRHAHRPTGSLDLWEFMEMVIRLAALTFPDETCLDSLVAESIQPNLAKDVRDEVARELAHSQCQQVLFAHNTKLLKVFEFFSGDAKSIKAQAETRGKQSGRNRRGSLGTYNTGNAESNRSNTPVQGSRRGTNNKENFPATPMNGKSRMSSPAQQNTVSRRTDSGGLMPAMKSRMSTPLRPLSTPGLSRFATPASIQCIVIPSPGALSTPLSTGQARRPGFSDHDFGLQSSTDITPVRYPPATPIQSQRRAATPSRGSPASPLQTDIADGMECTLPFNNVLTMMEVLNLFSPQLSPTIVTKLVVQVTANNTLVPTCHVRNHSNMIYSEFLELLGRCAHVCGSKPLSKTKHIAPLHTRLNTFLSQEYLPAVKKLWQGKF